MFHLFKSRRSKLAFIGVIFIGFVIRILVAWQPISILLAKNLPDDAYYYFMLAHNAIQHGIVSVDAVNPTNGFHPLWFAFLLPIFGWAHLPGNLQVHLALTLACILDVVSMWVIGQTTVVLTRKESWGVLAIWLYAINPIVILQTTNGLETPLASLTLLLFLWLFIQWLTRSPSVTTTIFVGIAGGFMFLARSDSVFFLGFALLAAVWYWRNQAGLWRSIVAGIVSVLVVIPWFTWSYFAVGGWFQDSGMAVPYAIRQRVAIEYGEGISVVFGEILRQFAFLPGWLRGDASGLPLVFGFFLWLIVLVGLFFRWRTNPVRLEMVVVLPFLGAGLALIVVHLGIRWYPRPWYFMSTAIAFAISFILVMDAYMRSEKAVFYSVSMLSIYLIVSGYIFWQVGYYPWQIYMLETSDWISENIPTGANVASFNSGIYAYYSNRRVVNLDGVVNHKAFQAIQQSNVLEYIHQSEIDYLIDTDNAIQREYAPFMGKGYPEALEEIAILGGKADGPLGLLRVYRINHSFFLPP